MANLLPKPFCKVCQNLEVNLGSLSDTILEDIPCSLTTSLIYNEANLSIDILKLIARKWALLVSRSTITQIVLRFQTDRGKCVTKSIAMLSHFQTGISNWCNIPPGFLCSTFAFWQVKQKDMN